MAMSGYVRYVAKQAQKADSWDKMSLRHAPLVRTVHGHPARINPVKEHVVQPYLLGMEEVGSLKSST